MKTGLAAGALLLLTALVIAGACSPLRTFNAVIPTDGGTRIAAHDVPYGADPRQMLDVYAPSNAAPGAHLPVIVFFYGGSWASGSRAGYGWVGRALAAQGFVTVIPDYRLVPQVRFPGFVADGAAAVGWAHAHAARYGGDGTRIVLAGHSAGAYIAAMLAVDPQWLGADRSAVRGLIGLAGPYDFAPFDVPASIDAFGQWPRVEETQPVHYAGAGDPPALLLHGDADTTVQPRNSRALAAALRKANVPVELKIYPGVGHVGLVTSIARPFRGKAPTLADMAAFAHRVTGS